MTTVQTVWYINQMKSVPCLQTITLLLNKTLHGRRWASVFGNARAKFMSQSATIYNLHMAPRLRLRNWCMDSVKMCDSEHVIFHQYK